MWVIILGQLLIEKLRWMSMVCECENERVRAILAADMSIIKSESLGPLHGYEARATGVVAAAMCSLAHE